jgi:hypothetical protein
MLVSSFNFLTVGSGKMHSWILEYWGVTPSARQTALPTFAPSEIKPLADLIEREILARS